MGDDNVAIVVGVVAFAQLGTLGRLALGEMKQYDQHQMSSVLYANCLGCLAIGALNEMQPVLQRKGASPMFVSGTAGFCGALTTFSTWQLEVARWLVWWPIRSMPPAPTGGAPWAQRAFSAFVALLTELGVACVGYQLGRALVRCSVAQQLLPPPVPDPEGRALGGGLGAFGAFGAGRPSTRELSICESQPLSCMLGHPRLRRHGTSCNYLHGADLDGRFIFLDGGRDPLQRGGFLALLAVLLLLSVWLGLLRISLLASVGALLRYSLSLALNHHYGLGTLVANVGACAILGALTIQTAAQACYVGQDMTKSWIKAVAFGFCGALSTTSTFVAHMHDFHTRFAIAYGVVSVVFAQFILCGFLGWYLTSSGATHVCG